MSHSVQDGYNYIFTIVSGEGPNSLVLSTIKLFFNSIKVFIRSLLFCKQCFSSLVSFWCMTGIGVEVSKMNFLC